MYKLCMNLSPQLTPGQRAFFSDLARTAFCNPFSAQRQELDLKLSGADPRLDRIAITRAAMARIKERVAELEATGGGDFTRFAAQDAAILRTSFLFEIFHDFMGEFDDHIRSQLQAGDKTVPLPCAGKALAAFAHRGFAEPEAHRYLAFFFQLRRAFFFINRDLVGDSPCMNAFRCRLWNNLFTHDIQWFEGYLWDRMEDFSTLLLGETGTGKGAAAAAIGRSGHIPFDAKSGRFSECFTRNFISCNLSQFPESLLESELFGHKKGAFTGAVADYQGIFARCSRHGAIFLDEIGDLAVPVQIKLLQILQERSFSPVGGHDRLRFSGRVIAATNRPIQRLRREGKFRDDFYYRLCSDVIEVPSLRQRIGEHPAELRVLLERVLERIVGGSRPELAQALGEILERTLGRAYPWPGNVRELEQAVRRILLSGEYQGEIAEASAPDADLFAQKVGRGELTAAELVASYCDMLHQRHGSCEKVARIAGLDRRTVRKHLDSLKD
ncbi:MAG: sigma-54-dependent Fis family transcriptional regulator [Deltaproteobacteria bacterium]|nr:sigma-54-dependent Fis family transcriptional regulator [Deltaproteobacteria bacterium]